jgi:hypothetical protein
MTGCRGLRARVAALLVLAGALTACSAPSSTFVASPEDDLVLKLPRSWSTLRSGPSADSTTGQPDGGWVAVFDGAPTPDVKHVDLDSDVKRPVAYAQVSVLSADQASGMNGDKLRDLLLPFTATSRAQVTDSRVRTFQQISDYDVHAPNGSGVHVVFSYDLGKGREVFDQIALLGSKKTRVYMLLIRCSLACYAADKAQIDDVVAHFTVKVP